MTDKTDEQVAKERAAVGALRNASSHMKQTLEYVDRLQQALAQAAHDLDEAAKHVPENAYKYQSDKTIRALVKEHAANARKAI